MTRYYTFTLDGRHIGYYLIEESADRIYENAIFRVDGERIENPFALKLDGGRIVAYRRGEGEWQPMPDEARLYPGSAYPLLVPHVEGEFHFTELNEADGARRPATLRREGDVVTESVAGRVTRRFWLAEGEIVRIDWGGALSELCPSLAEARGDSGL